MKRLIILLFPVLASCTAVDALLMTKFDGSEYQQITEIRIDAGEYKTQCDDPDKSKLNAMELSHKTLMFEAYSEHLPRNGDSYKASQALNEIAQGLKDHYAKGDKVSIIFCKLKFEGIEHSADTMQHVLGNRPR
jgi:hypothetical protein